MRRIKNWAAAAVCGLTLVANAYGQQKGDKLVVVAKNAEMKSEATVVQTVRRGNPLVVQEVDGPWLWVHLFGKSGWIHSRDVVLEGREMDYWNEVLRRDPRDYDGLVARAQILIAQDDLTGALAGTTEAIRVDPKQDWAYRLRSEVWARKGEYDLALADANEAIHVEPQKALTYLNRGEVYKKKGEYDKALADLNESLRLDPTNADTFEQRGYVFNGKKEFDKAIADFTSAIRIDKKSSSAYAGRSYARSKIQEFRGALSDCDEAIQLNPKSTEALYRRAKVHGTMGRPAQALADLEHILRLKPDDAQSLNGVAWLLATCPNSDVRNGRRAVELAKTAVELSKKHGNANPNCLDTLAAAYAEAGDFSNATRTQQQAIEGTVAANKADWTTRLDLYKSGKPYRDVPATNVSTAYSPAPAPQPRSLRNTEEEFHVSPRIVRIKAYDGSEYSVCVAAVIATEDQRVRLVVADVGPSTACSSDPEDYFGKKLDNLAVATAKFAGDCHEKVVIDGEMWMYEVYPAAVYRKIGVNRDGEDQWDSFCMVTLKQDPKTLNGARPKRSRLLVFPKQKSEVVDGIQFVYADAIQEAWKNRIELKHPSFIGDLSKLQNDPAVAAKQ